MDGEPFPTAPYLAWFPSTQLTWSCLVLQGAQLSLGSSGSLLQSLFRAKSYLDGPRLMGTPHRTLWWGGTYWSILWYLNPQEFRETVQLTWFVNHVFVGTIHEVQWSKCGVTLTYV